MILLICPATNTFDADKTNPDLLSLSPYPTAFTASTSKNYYLTKVGLLKDFLCSSVSGMTYFRVGSEGNCPTANCNGVLPDGSTVNFKYLLLDPTNKTILSETKWSEDISLYALQNPDAIDDSLPGRSAAMVVITAILCVAVFLLILLLLSMLILALCWDDKEPIRALGSLRIPEYDTHNFKDPAAPYINPSFEHDPKSHPIFTSPSPIILQ
ncbi:uroplakin-3b [Clupea harengus]|uniref:Uroplakin-3b n=1 Tax=Clupea harengus TaxID=7950 RepID=A0A6P8FYS5_CLUHA|nr:uroplakin-3b [Clupea harengus]